MCRKLDFIGKVRAERVEILNLTRGMHDRIPLMCNRMGFMHDRTNFMHDKI